jgi:hypothetical protein
MTLAVITDYMGDDTSLERELGVATAVTRGITVTNVPAVTNVPGHCTGEVAVAVDTGNAPKHPVGAPAGSS